MIALYAVVAFHSLRTDMKQLLIATALVLACTSECRGAV
jgi:hypothetical protein